MRINQNILAMQTQGTLTVTNTRLEKSIEKLSSGLRINRAADDAAGLAISEKLRRQIRGLSRATLNAQDGISMIQTAEGSLNESHSILQRMRELAIQAGNDTLTSNDRLEVQKEVLQLRDDLNRISRNTEFNTKKLLDGSQTALLSSSSSAVRGYVTGGSVGAGGDYDVSIGLISGGISQMTRSQIFTKKGVEPSVLASGNTQLQSIAQFYDPNGVFVIDPPKTINIQGNNKNTSVTIDGQMTLDRLAATLQGAINTSAGLEISNSKVMVVGTAMSGVSNLGGYIQITSGMVGDTGRMGFMSDQTVMSALGLATVRDAKNNLHELTLTDGSGNRRQIRTETHRASGLLDGIDVSFTSQAAQIAGTQGLVEGLNLSANETFTISAGGINANITLNAGSWTMEGIARSINYQTGINGFNISGLETAVVEGQIRMTMTPPDSTVNSNITIGNAANTSVLGLLNGTYSGFVDGEKNNTKLEWGYSRYVASAAAGTLMDIQVDDGVAAAQTLQVFSAAGSLGTALQTTADMIRFTDLQADANSLFKANGIEVRLDQVEGAMAFTSTRVGRENLSNAPSNQSLVNLTNLGGLFNTRFGFDNASNISARGQGDMNFRLHVVDNHPQYQIGADQGQTLQVTFSDMSAEALDVANLDMTNIAGATRSLGKINDAIDKVSAERSKLGAFQNRLEYAINNLRSTNTNLTAAESRIRDVDVAQEMIEFTRDQIVSQSGNAMLAQANTIPQMVLQLLK